MMIPLLSIIFELSDYREIRHNLTPKLASFLCCLPNSQIFSPKKTSGNSHHLKILREKFIMEKWNMSLEANRTIPVLHLVIKVTAVPAFDHRTWTRGWKNFSIQRDAFCKKFSPALMSAIMLYMNRVVKSRVKTNYNQSLIFLERTQTLVGRLSPLVPLKW